MKLSIMQPYFLPYLGYFQLIDASDAFVNLDHVSFMKRSYMVRNTLKNNVPINIQVNKGSQNKSCREVTVNFDNKWIEKTLKKITTLYNKEKNFQSIMQSIIIPNFKNELISVSEFNLRLIKSICSYLEIDVKFLDTSLGITDKKRGDGLIDICKNLGYDEYINAIGGMSLYDKEYFLKNDIDLSFIKTDENLDLKNPYASILDLLFIYEKQKIQKELKKYKLI